MGKKFKLSRKRKKKYKKDLGSESLYKISNTIFHWEWFYFRRRVEVNSMYTILGCPDNGEICKKTGKWIRYETPKKNYIDDEILLEWYKKYYPNDKLAHHYCRQNRKMWNKFK